MSTTESIVYYVGTPAEAEHHAEPLRGSFDVRVLPPHDVLAAAKAGDVAIFFSEHFDRFRATCLELKRRQIATIYAIDGIIEWRNAWENRPHEPACPWTMRPVLAHKVACIGAHQARLLASWGHGNAHKIERIGLPRLDRLLPARPQHRPPRDDEFHLLVLSAKCPGFTDEQIETTLAALRDVNDWSRCTAIVAGRRLHVHWRLAPALAAALEVDSRWSDLSGRELAGQIEACDAVLTTPSTAILEAMLLGRPAALLDYHRVPSYLPAAWTVRQSGDLAIVVPQLIAPAPPRWHFQQSVLRDELDAQTPATPRLVGLIEAMQRQAADCLERDLPLQFAPRLVLPPAIPADDLPHGEVYPDHAAFRSQELTQLQVELAHARREIDYLNRELAQLASELATAHQIFDQIRQHPVAGPIVRLRQKWLDTLQRLQGGPRPASSPNPSDRRAP